MRIFRRSRPRSAGLRSLTSRGDYERYIDETAHLRAEKAAVMARLMASSKRVLRLDGFSVPANRHVVFTIDKNLVLSDGRYNLRETVNCPQTGFNMRMRASIHAVRHFETDRSSRVVMFEQQTPLYRYFCTHYDAVAGSEYLGDKVPLGTEDAAGRRNEDATQLTYADDSFDIALSFEVLEHIPDYHRALEETARILRPGGRFYFTAPFTASREETQVRAKCENGRITHILPPEYHGDPVREEGILCFQYFGWDIVDALRTVGFRDVEAIVFDETEYGYYTEDPVLVFRATADHRGPMESKRI